MKKLFCLILGVIFMIPVTVKADMGPPQISTYKATPVSKEGATYYKDIFSDKLTTGGTYDYNEELTVTAEFKSNGKVYVEACSTKDKCGYVLITDLKLTKGADLSAYKGNYKARVFDKNGVVIYEGPGYIYKKTNVKIPYGTEIVTSSYEGNEGTWLRVNYNGVEGFVDSDDAAVMVLYKGARLIKSNNEIVTEFYMSNPWDQKFGYKVNNNYVIDDDVLFHQYLVEFTGKNEFKATTDIPLYKRYEFGDNRDQVGTIKKGTTVKFIYDATYQGSEDYYVEANGKKGWVTFDFEETKNYFENYNENAETKVYRNEPVDSKSDNSNDDTTPGTEQLTGDVVTPGQDDGDVVVPKADKDDDFFAGFSKNQIILISAVGVGVIVLTAVITMILVNKKKNKKVATSEVEKDESVQE